MSNINPEWQFVALSVDIPAQQLKEISVATKSICFLRKEDQLYAFAAQCPHAGGRLCEGNIDPQGNIECPLHQYRFNPVNGYNTSGEGYKLMTYPVREEDGQVFVKY